MLNIISINTASNRVVGYRASVTRPTLLPSAVAGASEGAKQAVQLNNTIFNNSPSSPGSGDPEDRTQAGYARHPTVGRANAVLFPYGRPTGSKHRGWYKAPTAQHLSSPLR